MGSAKGTTAARAADGRAAPRVGPAQARRRGLASGSDRHRRGLAPLGRREIEAMLRALEEDAEPEGGGSGETVDDAFDEMAGGLPDSLAGLSAYMRHAGSAMATLSDRDEDW